MTRSTINPLERWCKLTMLSILVIYVLQLIYFYAVQGKLMFNWFFELSNGFDVSGVGYFLKNLMILFFDICLIIGLLFMIIKKTWQINKLIKAFILFFWCTSFVNIFMNLLTIDYGLLGFRQGFEQSPPVGFYIFNSLKMLFLMASAVYFYKITSRIQTIHRQEVGKGSRFLNRLIDFAVITCLVYADFDRISSGYIFEDVEILNSTPYWLLTVVWLFYYIIFESIFLQTLGKLHNDSYVRFKGNRLSAIAVRSLCRLIPFDAFSFLGEKGWHDSLSNTEVVN